MRGGYGKARCSSSAIPLLPAKIYANEGIAQVLFFESDEPCEVSYKDKAGKYQPARHHAAAAVAAKGGPRVMSVPRALLGLAAVGLVAAFPTGGFASPWLPRLGVEAGVNRGRLDSSNLFLNGEHWKYGGGAGLIASWTPAPGWSLEGAPGWERQVRRGTGSVQFGGTGGTTTQTMDQTVRFDRVLLPMRAAWRPGWGGLTLEAGMAAAWLGRAGRSVNVVAQPAALTTPGASSRPRAQPDASIFESAGTFNTTDWTDHFRRWDAVWSTGAGWDQPLGGHVLRARFRWQQGFENLAKFGDPVRLSSAAASLGLLW
jgi:hypothetical protein